MEGTGFKRRFATISLGASLCVALSGCGAGGDSDGSSSSTTALTTSGVAAIGSAIVGGTVSFICASGATASATTGSDGSYSATLKSADYPCAAQVSGGQANGAVLASPLHSVAAAPGTTNVTPLTDLIVGVLGDGNTSALDNAKSGDLARIVTIDNLSSALTKVKAAIATLPGNLTVANGFDPLNSQFSVGDANDALLDRYATSLAAADVSQQDAAAKIASGNPLIQQAYSATAYTTPGITAIRMGTSLNLDGTLGIAIADPNRASYFAIANTDSNGNVISFTNSGQFTATGFVSQLNNRIGELCTAGVGGFSQTQHSQYVYVSNDMVPVTDPTELAGKTFAEYEDCAAYGTATISATAASTNLSYVYTQTGASADPAMSFTQALSDQGYADGNANAKVSMIRAKAYKYMDQTGKTTYVYVMVASLQGSTVPAINGESDYVVMGVSQ